MRYVRRDAPEVWQRHPWLADLCEAARLSRLQAEAVRLVAERLTFGEVAVHLSLLAGRRITNRAARAMVRVAEFRLRGVRADLFAIQRRETKELLVALQNVRRSQPARHIYRERLGTHDREPVMLSSRLVGEHAADLFDRPGRFIRDLPALLAVKREQELTRAAG